MEDDLNHRLALELRNKRRTMLATCKDSHAIAKQRAREIPTSPSPTVRIIHVFAPEIIRTDPSNFRELVQKLTGKPILSPSTKHKPTRKQQPCALPESSSSSSASAASPIASGVEQEAEASSRRSTANSGFFFNGLGNLDSILADHSQTGSSDTSQSPFLPLNTNHHHVF